MCVLVKDGFLVPSRSQVKQWDITDTGEYMYTDCGMAEYNVCVPILKYITLNVHVQ